jgi:pimeloyl-ACP methyl ester carboxylesterase
LSDSAISLAALPGAGLPPCEIRHQGLVTGGLVRKEREAVPVSRDADDVDDVLVTAAGRRVGWLARGPADGTPALYVHGWVADILAVADALGIDRFPVIGFSGGARTS